MSLPVSSESAIMIRGDNCGRSQRMLILSRKEGEWVQLADNIRVHVVSIRGGVVRLGFTAPDDVAIYRSELLDRDGQPKAKPEKGT